MADSNEGRVEGLYINPAQSKTIARESVNVAWGGFEGDKHFGDTMPRGSGQKFYPKGSEIRNTRQISIVASEELAQIAHGLQVPAIDGAWLNANILVSGIADFTQLSPGTRIIFKNGVGLVVEGSNPPCTTAGGQIQENYPEKQNLAQEFVKHAVGRRGVVAWVERPGKLAPGERFQIHRPK